MATGISTIKQGRHPAITAASILCFIIGVGWTVGSIPPIVYVIRNRALPMIGPIRVMSGPFEALGIDALILRAAGEHFLRAGKASIFA